MNEEQRLVQKRLRGFDYRAGWCSIIYPQFYRLTIMVSFSD